MDCSVLPGTTEMDNGETNRRLDAITDAGKFERLATAVLREANSEYRLLAHPGVNTEGKTIRAPVDGIAFVTGARPPHMIAVHHTTCARDDLEGKWLHDPATVKPRKGKKPTQPPGDLIKTAKMYQVEKARAPNLRATLILTTNREPAEDLVRTVNAAGQAAGLDIEIWSRSVLAHFLDIDPNGQWIRKTFLGIEQERLSAGLLREVSSRSVELNRPPDDTGSWVERGLDESLAQLGGRDVVFVVAESGLGKSVACYKRLTAHVEAGGFGLVLPHAVIAGVITLDQAIDAALRQLHPPLAPNSGSEARALASESTPLLLVVEDINKSGQPAALLERLSSWSTHGKERAQRTGWQILCPVWPRILASLGDETRRRISALALAAKPFSPREGTAAVVRRRERAGTPVTQLEAEAVSAALGHDPLLIALHDPAAGADPDTVIANFIAASLGRLAEDRGEYSAAEYHDALRRLAVAMLERRRLALTMIEAASWFEATPDIATRLRHIARFGEIMRIAGPASDEHLAFRHDRVRDWLLTDAAADLMRREVIPETLLEEPHFAEVMGAALLRSDVPVGIVDRIRVRNPLALFCAMRSFGEPVTDVHRVALAAAEGWLDERATHGPENINLRWEALQALSECESPNVIRLVQRFNEPRDWWALRARFRNGDLRAGIELCRQHEPGIGVVGHLELIEYVQRRHGVALITRLDTLLRGNELTQEGRIGALRLAGHLMDGALAGAIEASWRGDSGRHEHLDDYLWACAQCCGDDPARLLHPICEAWAALSDEPREKSLPSPRDELAAHHIRWAFQKRLPEPALRYFIARAKMPELQWQITYMLHGIDHPDAVEFIARELAAAQARVEGTGSFSPFALTAKDEWGRRQEESGRQMSAASRARLYELWKDEANEKHLKKEAFRLWAATIVAGDIAVLRGASASETLADMVLWERLRRGDREAIPLLIPRLRQENRGYWWQTGRFVWSDELSRMLDEELTRRGGEVGRRWDFKEEKTNDWITAPLVMRLPVQGAESLLLKHWEHLRFSPYFVQTALYVATPRLTKAAAEAISECPDPKTLFEHLSMHWSVKTIGHPGVSRLVQVEGLLSYLDHLGDMDIQQFWDVCNEHGWFELRRRHFDHRLRLDRKSIAYTDDTRAMAELDRLIADKRRHWADFWADDFLKTGVSVDHVMDVVRRWLAPQKDVVALELAANIVIHAGKRRHLSVLAGHAIEPADRVAQVIANSTFAVRRRSLN